MAVPPPSPAGASSGPLAGAPAARRGTGDGDPGTADLGQDQPGDERAAPTADRPRVRRMMPGGLLRRLPRQVVFTGKGGVGKTTLACAVGVALADRGQRVLLVSTDPASNLADTLGVHATGRPEPCPEVPGLDLLDIDPQAEAARHREALLAPVRELLPADALARAEEELSGSCTQEVAVFDRFSDLLAGDVGAEYDAVLYDTAPTGHTLRLLELPGAWTEFLDRGAGDPGCLGPLAGLEARRAVYRRALAALRDPTACALVLVARPAQPSLAEAARTLDELSALGVEGQALVLNGRWTGEHHDDALAAGLADEQARVRRALDGPLAALPRLELPLLDGDTTGPTRLRRLLDTTPRPSAAPRGEGRAIPLQAGFPRLQGLVDALAERPAGLVLVMGKGGVGKTSLAAAVALGLAERGRRVHLSTTDPANHLAQVLPEADGTLSVSAVDPAAAVAAHRAAVLERAAPRLDAEALALLEEDLRSPCTEEVAVFGAFAELVERADDEWVVLDTAPTGHTLLLLDATGAYERQRRRQPGAAQAGPSPLERLRDGDRTHVLLTTLAETTPVLEAERLEDDLARAGIRPWAWVLNQVLSAVPTQHPLLLARARAEAPLLRRVQQRARRWAAVPRQPVGPRGREELAAWSRPPQRAERR